MPFFFSYSYSCCVVAGWLAQPFPSLSDCVFVILVSSVVASCSGKIQSVAVVKNCLLGVLFSCSGVDECEVHLLVFLLSVGVVVFILQNFFAYVCLCFNLSHFLIFYPMIAMWLLISLYLPFFTPSSKLSAPNSTFWSFATRSPSLSKMFLIVAYLRCPMKWNSSEIVTIIVFSPIFFLNVAPFFISFSFGRGVVGSPVSFLLQVGEDELFVFVGQLDVVLQLICDVSLFSEDSLCLV